MANIARIHVNQHVIKKNAKTGERKPTLTVKTSGTNVRALKVRIDGPSELVYSPDKPLDCGATVWVETTSPVFADEYKLHCNESESEHTARMKAKIAARKRR